MNIARYSSPYRHSRRGRWADKCKNPACSWFGVPFLPKITNYRLSLGIIAKSLDLLS